MKNFLATFFSIGNLFPAILIIAILIYFFVLGVCLIIGILSFEDGDFVLVRRKKKSKYYIMTKRQRLVDIGLGVFCTGFALAIIYYLA